VKAKQLYNNIMVRSQRGAYTSAKLESGETVDDLSERLQNLAVSLPELEGAAGDAVLLQRFTDALPEELQVHACGISGDCTNLNGRQATPTGQPNNPTAINLCNKLRYYQAGEKNPEKSTKNS
jgi:hypothetical protein